MEVTNASEGLSARAAAKEIGVSYQTILNWIKKGDLPATRFGPSGRIVRIHPDDLAAMRHQDDNEQEGTP